MLVFIDESGDTGRKLNEGSSRYFVISLLIFDDHEEANNCDQRINLLRKELRLPDNFEFHFYENSNAIRESFIFAINPYQFMYFGVVIDKDLEKLFGEGFKTKESFYKYACQMLFTNAKSYLDRAIVILDKSGSPDFRMRLEKYLKSKMNGDREIIKKIKQQRSNSNNLLQLADYISAIINRKHQNKKDWDKFYKYIKAKELLVQVWPK